MNGARMYNVMRHTYLDIFGEIRIEKKKSLTAHTHTHTHEISVAFYLGLLAVRRPPIILKKTERHGLFGRYFRIKYTRFNKPTYEMVSTVLHVLFRPFQ